jgi:pre-60S factor REI1
MSSRRHKQRVLMAEHKDTADDAASSVMSSTFSLGEPISPEKEEVDSDAEEEFHEVVEGLKKASLENRPSPVKRPSNPHPSAQQREEDLSDREENNKTPVATKSEPAWTNQTCLFCNYASPSIPLNAHHMERFHGCFIPEKKFVVNLEGLIEHLQKRIHDAHQCITCGKIKANTFAVQTHMRDKSHCSIPYTSMDEQLDIGEFYDFRSTYSDDESEDGDMETTERSGGAKLGAERSVKHQLENGEDVNPDDEAWETDSDSSLESSEITALYGEGHYHQYERLDKHTHHTHDDPRPHHQVDGWHSHAHKHTHAAFYDDHSLHLPGGKSVGHRSLNVYYRQNLHHYPSMQERAERRMAIEGAHPDKIDDETEKEVAIRFGSRTLSKRDVGAMAGVPDAKKKAVQKAEIKGRQQQQKSERAAMWRKQRSANKTEAYSWNIGMGVLD